MPISTSDKIINVLKPGLRVVVTAGGSGIGRVIADMLITHGARVHICDVADDLLADFRSAHPDAGTTKADVSKDADVEQLFAEAQQSLGGLDVLVNNAGIAGPTGGVDEIDPDDWRRCIDVCLTGQFLCTRLAVPMIKAAGGGAIVNMSSVAGRLGYAYRTPYSSAKWGVIGLTQSLAKELGSSNISVNAILPGVVEGPRIERVISARAEQVGVSYEEMKQQYVQQASLRRMVKQEDIGAMVLFLVSPAGANVSGQSISVCANVENI